MSNTAAEAVPVTQPPVEGAAAAPAAATEAPATTAAQPKKFANVQKSIGTKAKAVLDAFHSAGEVIRGNINAALDGAGDAIAGRKSGEVVGRKSGEQSRRSMDANPPTGSSTPVPATTTIAPETNAEPESPAEQTAEKRFPVGQRMNTSFKRTLTLVHRVGGTLRSKSTSTIDSLGNTLSEGKQRASRRFSKAPKTQATEAENPATADAAPAAAEATTSVGEATTPAPVAATS